ncbi:Oidioi.mRNA.OKI2018_I69.PAR.g9296.t1.cds [Oikopleura dioica]|uniref:Oidioi.mRNA.OKI2018_I69.PAR.g9296.t1.cds n=1 Tax=Oikopleura dioica TaxID=34765 RepID=A0ABN7RK01_OIKDI|nr:Oidioi.mRNA.OKI2018_I69.PAR.g9296.t1.cds [Oikopleura dioica]
MFNPSLDHICACQKYYPNFSNFEFDFGAPGEPSFSDSDSQLSLAAVSSADSSYSWFDEGAFDDVPDIDQNQLNNVTVGKQAILWISLLVGAPLNIIILIVTLSNWQRKFSSSALFVVHLCIADLLICIHAFINLYDKNDLASSGGILMCIYMETSTQFFICLSVFSLAAIAFDRCVHLVSHTLSRISVKNHYFLFGMVWVLSIALVIPQIMMAEMHETYQCRIVYSKYTEEECTNLGNQTHETCASINGTHSECQAPKLPYQIYYYIIFAVLGFLAPLLIIVVSYILILWSIVKSQVRLGKLGQSNKETDTHVNLMIGSLFVTAIILIGPYIIFMFVLVASPEALGDPTCRNFKHTAEMMVYLSPIANAIMYSFCGKKFQKTLADTICCKNKRGFKSRSFTQTTRTGQSTRNQWNSHTIHSEPSLAIEMRSGPMVVPNEFTSLQS